MIWHDILAKVEQIIKTDSDPVITYGRELMDLPADLAALTTVAIKNPGMTVEVRTCAPEARPPFEWVTEITLRGTEYKHYLLRPDQTIVETYGKTVTDVSEADAQSLLATLASL
jgi:hypothetical protein